MKSPRCFLVGLAAIPMAASSAEASMATRFIRMQRVPVNEASRWIGKILEALPADDPDHIPFQTVPATRTNEVFMMGRIADMDLATVLLHIADGRFCFSLLR